MDDTGWDKIVDAIDAKFGIENHGRRSEPMEDRPDLTQQIAFIEFKRDGEDYRFERVTHAAIVDRKSHYHKTAGAGVRFENIYDESDVMHKTRLYKRVGGEWEPMNLEAFSL